MSTMGRHAGLGQAGREGDGVRLADADVEEARRGSRSRTFSSLLPWHMAAVMTADAADLSVMTSWMAALKASV